MQTFEDRLQFIPNLIAEPTIIPDLVANAQINRQNPIKSTNQHYDIQLANHIQMQIETNRKTAIVHYQDSQKNMIYQFTTKRSYPFGKQIPLDNPYFDLIMHRLTVDQPIRHGKYNPLILDNLKQKIEVAKTETFGFDHIDDFRWIMTTIGESLTTSRQTSKYLDKLDEKIFLSLLGDYRAIDNECDFRKKIIEHTINCIEEFIDYRLAHLETSYQHECQVDSQETRNLYDHLNVAFDGLYSKSELSIIYRALLGYGTNPTIDFQIVLVGLNLINQLEIQNATTVSVDDLIKMFNKINKY